MLDQTIEIIEELELLTTQLTILEYRYKDDIAPLFNDTMNIIKANQTLKNEIESLDTQIKNESEQVKRLYNNLIESIEHLEKTQHKNSELQKEIEEKESQINQNTTWYTDTKKVQSEYEEVKTKVLTKLQKLGLQTIKNKVVTGCGIDEPIRKLIVELEQQGISRYY